MGTFPRLPLQIFRQSVLLFPFLSRSCSHLRLFVNIICLFETFVNRNFYIFVDNGTVLV
nr:MAG TPA: hypothetical protein [Caudoviricetes sp.]